jgi:hypothetical protein
VRKTPQIPQDVFFQEPTPAAPAPAPTTTAKPQTTKTARPQAVKTSNSQKVQITLYLSDATAKDLERARYELLTRHNLRVPKSTIAEHAIAAAVRDLESLAQALAADQ